MDEYEYISVIKQFAGTYAPRGYAYCNGATLQIAHYQALFSLLGTRYGGDGQVTFKLPDLREVVDGVPVPFQTSAKPGWIICVEGIYPERP